MNPKVVVPVVLLVLFVVLPLIFAFWYEWNKRQASRVTQRDLTDPELIRLIHNEPDQMVSPHILADKTDLTLNQARSRLVLLMSYGILNRSIGGNRYFYGLKEPLAEAKNLPLSPDPFLTVEDLLTIFEAYDYRVSAQELIMATGLPLGVIKREMKHFEKKGIVQSMRGYAPGGVVISRFFALQEPYRSNPEQFREQANSLDLELKKILVDEKYLV